MYRTVIANVMGKECRDEAGRTLTRIGNMPVRAGDAVWTDGRVIYGNESFGSESLFLSGGRLDGILYAEPISNELACRIFSYPHRSFSEYRNGYIWLIDGEKAVWMCAGRQFVNLTNGVRADATVAEKLEAGSDMCVDKDGNLLLLGLEYDRTRPVTLRIYRIGAVDGEVVLEKTVDMEPLYAPLVAALKSDMAAHYSGTINDVHCGDNIRISRGAIHPDRSYNLLLSIDCTVSTQEPVSASEFQEDWRVYRIGEYDSPLIEKHLTVSQGYSGLRWGTTTGSRQFVMNSGGPVDVIYSGFSHTESEMRVHDVHNYNAQVYKRHSDHGEAGTLDSIPTEDIRQIKEWGVDLETLEIPFGVDHVRWTVIPKVSVKSSSGAVARWRLDDFDAEVTWSDGIAFSLGGHSYPGEFIRDAFELPEGLKSREDKGKTIRLVMTEKMVIKSEDNSPLSCLREYKDGVEGILSGVGVFNYRVRHCADLNRAKGIIRQVDET